MANTISNMKMTNPIKGLVSKRRKRYTQDGFNLDLSYIMNNLIAMGFPADRLEGVYRNHIDDVVKFLEEKHKDHYKIYNLCSERSYDTSKFQQRVAHYPFDDHNPPKIENIKPFCDDVHQWLSEDPNNVAVVHCKAGKGRTGVMVCCYLLHSRFVPTANEALNYYGHKRTTDMKGVTIPSQRRYVGYYASSVQEGLVYSPVKAVITEIRLEPLPTYNGTQASLQFVISEGNKKVYSSECYEVKKGQTQLSFRVGECQAVKGDIKIEFFNKQKLRKEKLFHFWFNTFFVRDEVRRSTSGCENGNRSDQPERSLSCDERTTGPHLFKPFSNSLGYVEDPKLFMLRIDKMDLDDAHKDKAHKLYPANFHVKVLMMRVGEVWKGEERQVGGEGVNKGGGVDVGVQGSQHNACESSDDSTHSSTPDDEEDAWESGEERHEVGRYRLLSDSDLRQQLLNS